MAALQLLILAIAAMGGLALLRVVRVRAGQEPHPESRLLLLLALFLGPPLVLGVLVDPRADQLRGLAWVPLYAIFVIGLLGLMWLASQVVRVFAPGRMRSLLMLALIGSDGADDEAVDPPVTARLAESVAVVDTTNAAFPRGLEFPAQVHRPGFRGSWDALDAATTTLEGRIADDERLGTAVASSARATAKDARSRLETLRHLAGGPESAWSN